MAPTAAIALWWSLFTATHLGLSSLPVRQRLIDSLGQRIFLLLYSVVAFATFIPFVSSYWSHRHEGTLLWTLSNFPGVWHLSLVLSVFGIILVAAAFAQPSPASLAPGSAEPRGVIRITRHPLFVGIAAWGIGHCLVNGFSTDVAFFGGLALFSLIGAVHQDHRKKTLQPRLQQFYSDTSILPFGAIFAGRNRFVPAEIPWLAVAGGAGLAIILYLLHPTIFS